jgi:hypothetical protein
LAAEGSTLDLNILGSVQHLFNIYILITVQKSHKSFLRKKGLPQGPFLRKWILGVIVGAFKTEISTNFFTECLFNNFLGFFG